MRLGLYLKDTGKRQITEEDDKKTRAAIKQEVVSALKQGAELKWPGWKELFTDVYDKITDNLKE